MVRFCPDKFDTVFRLRSDGRLALADADDVRIRMTVDVVSATLPCDVELSAVCPQTADVGDVFMRAFVVTRFGDAGNLADHSGLLLMTAHKERLLQGRGCRKRRSLFSIPIGLLPRPAKDT